MQKMQKKKRKFALGGFFQELGKTFMLPVALMAFMGLFLGLGSSFSSLSTIEAFPFLGNSTLQFIFRFMSAIGGFAFSNLAVMFAMAIPLGLAKREKGVAGFSGFVGYMVMNLAINFYLNETHQLASADKMQHAGQSLVLGVQSIDMGVLGGIITGIIVYNLHKKYCTIQLPDSLLFWWCALRSYYHFTDNGSCWNCHSNHLASFRFCDSRCWKYHSRCGTIWTVPVLLRRTFTFAIWFAPHFGGNHSFHSSRWNSSCGRENSLWRIEHFLRSTSKSRTDFS